MDPSRVTEDETEANKVIEYYKKYSQNPDLIKYFTGPEASFVGKRTLNIEIRKDVEVPQHISTPLNVEGDENNEHANCIGETSCKSQEIMQSPASLDIEFNQIVELEEIEEKNNSHTSSVESNKIEWDNGADIGYSNSYKLSTKKSASFPSLFTSNMSVKCNVLPTVIQEKSITENIKELRKMYNQLTFSSDTSFSMNKDNDSSAASKEQSIESSSSLQENQNVKSSTQSSSGDNYLQKKIGYPIAYSTPHEGSSSKESYSRSLMNYEGATSKGSIKHDGYTVTPMLTLPVTKRILNNDLPEQPGIEVSDDRGNDGNSLNQNVMRQKLVQKVDKFHKKINLCLTKPISVECISLESKKSVHKVVQTSFASDKSSKCVQTEESQLEIMSSEPVMVCTPLTQKIEYVRFSSLNSKNESDQSRTSSEKLNKPVSESSIHIKGNSTHDMKSLGTSEDVNLQGNNCKTTQTDLVSSKKIVNNRKTINNKESVNNKRKEIVKPSRTRKCTTYADSTEVSGSVNSSSLTSDDKTSTSGNIVSTEFDYKTADSVNVFQTEELLLTEMISLNHSKDLNTDIKRSIDILQKLLKSRKYDEATKKHYIKKIVQKIVDSKYSDDSTNSDLFHPKKTSNGHKFEDKTEYRTQNHKGTTKLMDNKPWYPISEPIYTIRKKMSKNSIEKKPHVSRENNTNLINSNVIQNQSFGLPPQKETLEIPKTQVNLAKETSVPLDEIPTSNSSRSRQTIDQNFKQKVTKPERNENFTKESPKITSNSSSRLAYSSSLDKENRPKSSDGKLVNANWKTAKTLSEKLLENRDSIDFRKGQGDYLLNVVKNERHHQLSWINNEIEHLVKLKELLEKKPKSRQPDSPLKEVIASLLRMKVGDMKVQSSSLQEAQHSRDKSNRSESSSKELQTHDEAPSISSANPAPAHTDNRQPNIQVYMCSTKNPTNDRQNLSERNKCSCSLETCKCSQTTTHEEKDVQCPAFRQCTCQTEPKEDANVQCNCKAHAGMTCNCDEINQDKENQCPCKKIRSSSSNSSSDSYMSCICCKKKKILNNLIGKVPLCEQCQEVNQKNFYPHNYSNPLHSCLCYNLVNRDILCQFKQTLTELERLDIYQQYCELLKNCKCCKECGCKCKLPKKFKNGCAYFLKLEDACPNEHCEGEGTNSNSSNYEEDGDGGENYLPEVTVKIPNCKGSCSRQKKNGKETKKYMSCPSIQNYLCTMKPDFVERAERRRRILKNASSQREENSENRKLKFIEKISYLNQRKRNEKFSSETDILRLDGYQTKAYCVFDIELNESPKKVQPRIFKSFKEMKDLTRRKYLHLSEVRNKKTVYREKRLREANRLLANTFTRRLQRSTLRGAVDIPLNVKVVSY